LRIVAGSVRCSGTRFSRVGDASPWSHVRRGAWRFGVIMEE
jgi:hypothetical protein